MLFRIRRRRAAWVTIAALVLLQAAVAQLPPPPALRAWSRSASESADGFYFQPEILGEDYPQATPEQIERDIRLARRAGARALRFGVSWLETEPERGRFDWSKLDAIIDAAVRERMPVIPYLCYTPKWASTAPNDPSSWAMPPQNPQWFADFASAVATRYRGKVLAWGLWNEPDNPSYWKGTADQLAVLIHAGSEAIRRADPAAGIWMGGMSGGADAFFDRLIATDHAATNVNAVGLHGYPKTWDARTPAEYYPEQLEAMRRVLDSAGERVDLWADENGYSDYRYSTRSASRDVNVPIHHAYEHTPLYQAVMLWRDHIEVLASGEASLMGWYRIHDLPRGTNTIGDENNRFLGLVDIHGQEKPAFAALRFYDRLFDAPTRSLDAKVMVRPARDAEVHAIEKKDGTVVVTGWISSDESKEHTRHLEVKFPPQYHFARARTYTVTGVLLSDKKLGRGKSNFVLRDFVVNGAGSTIVVLSRE